MDINHLHCLLRCHFPIGRLGSAFIVGRQTQQVKHLWKESANTMFDSVANDQPRVTHRENNQHQDVQQVGCSFSKGIPQGFRSI